MFPHSIILETKQLLYAYVIYVLYKIGGGGLCRLNNVTQNVKILSDIIPYGRKMFDSNSYQQFNEFKEKIKYPKKKQSVEKNL